MDGTNLFHFHMFSAFLFLSYYLPTACLSIPSPNITTDQSALLAIKTSITFPPDHILATNWTTTTPSSVCDWVGITCGKLHRRVTALDLPKMGLTGTIPPHLGNLSFLVRLNIGNNSFYGDLPKELANLCRLQHIDVWLNNFSGQIPQWFGAFPKLVYLNVANNSFSGSVPQDFGNLQSLKVLNMQFNLFTGSIPGTIFNISSLEHLGFTGNSLSGNLLADVCNYLPNLEFLSLSFNELEGEFPPGLQECSKLQILSLSHNQFTGRIPSELGNLTKLTELYLGYNSLEGEIPHEFANLVNLQLLALHSAGLTGLIPSFLFNMSSLEKIYFFENNFSGSLPRNICPRPLLSELLIARNKVAGNIPNEVGNCTVLRRIDLGENNFAGTIPEEFGSLSNLEYLRLSFNSFTGHIPENVFNLSTLTMILLAYCNLEGNLPPTLGLRLPNLQRLFLGGNGLTGTIPYSISNASQLAYLTLTENKFTGLVPHSLGNLRFLDLLSLGGNNLSSEPELDFITSLTSCRLLTRLSIESNPFYTTFPASVGNLSTSLETFFADKCGFMGNIPPEIGNLSSLVYLSLAGNDLSRSLPTIVRGLKNLQGIFFFNNKLNGSIPDDLCHLQNLVILSLNSNEIFGSIPSCLGNISTLRNLSLSSNKLTSNIPPSLWSLKDLLEFDLSSNSFSGIIPSEIGNLRAVIRIDLSMNQLHNEIPSTIEGIQTLIYLSLAHNRFEGPIPGSFQKLISVEFLDLSYNNLSGVIPMSLEALSHLKYFNVSFNQLSGEIPSGGPFLNFTSMSFASNEALCGASRFHVLPCHDGSPQHSRMKKVLIFVFLSVAITSIILVLISTCVFIKHRRKNQIPTPSNGLAPITHRRIAYHELVRATNAFDQSTLLGTGSFSSVYKGVLIDGTILAIKVFNLQLEGAFRSFDTECDMLRNVRHRNLTKVISSCSNLDFKALVLEYMPNGSLENWLYSFNRFLDFQQRLDIVVDVAHALDYLHSGYIIPVVHCDLKPSNVLLDEDMVAHVSDFGISKFLRDGDNFLQTNTLATIGYIAPEYGQEGLVSTNCDVYSFGIMMMEIFTRKKPTDEMFNSDLSLSRWVSEALVNGVIQAIDSRLIRKEEEHFFAKVNCVSSIFELALNCTAESPENRINIKDALALLQKIRLKFLAKLSGN